MGRQAKPLKLAGNIYYAIGWKMENTTACHQAQVIRRWAMKRFLSEAGESL